MRVPLLVRIPLLGLVLLVLAACATTPATAPAPPEPAPGPASTPPQPPPGVTDALLPPMRLPAPRHDEPLFDIDVAEVEARAFFMGLVRDSDYNMVVHPSVTGTISLTLSDVTIPEVMEVVRQVYGYEYELTRNGFLVMPARLQSRIFHVNYLNLRRDGESQTRVSSGEALREPDGHRSDPGVISGPRTTAEAYGSRVRTSTQSDFWRELSDALVAIVGDGEGRSVVVTPQSSLVLVRGLPSELREAEAYLSDVQNSMNRQVILEAKVIEVELSDGFQAGINWAGLTTGSRSGLLAGQGGGGDFPENPNSTRIIDLIDPESGAFRPFDRDTGIAANPFGGIFSAALYYRDFSAFIELLESQGDVHVLSSPRVSTVNNQKAVIKVGTDEFFVTDISATTVVGTAATTSPNVTLTPFFSGIALDVTPQISPEGDVILHIHPAVSEVVDQRKDLTLGGETQSVPLALSTVRESDSIVRARSGQIVVIGGMMQESRENMRGQVPWLGDVPVLGRLFRQQRRMTRKTELVILLRPVVVDHDGVWDGARDVGSERMRELIRGQGFH
ncbi:pilus (MSHA type) biogenesis protein MshL [Thioalkalivibrio thiocyanodenitrificans]|uniref:pilus (MSHA type) biogenesis protein MshL n=1 Tax=Thioalkalivibrio thiocyanodenitrificans TaxID=243063 RepID=UPI0012E9FCC1|nr:pilus (MSHA type) biogenesis protein MshL [Thioalkalivibrio thiocyanodenitrificans]